MTHRLFAIVIILALLVAVSSTLSWGQVTPKFSKLATESYQQKEARVAPYRVDYRALNCPGESIVLSEQDTQTLRRACAEGGDQTVFLENVQAAQLFYKSGILYVTTFDGKVFRAPLVEDPTGKSLGARSWNFLGASGVYIVDAGTDGDGTDWIRVTSGSQFWKVRLEKDAESVTSNPEKVNQSDPRFDYWCSYMASAVGGDKLCLTNWGLVRFAPTIPFVGMTNYRAQNWFPMNLLVSITAGEKENRFYALQRESQETTTGQLNELVREGNEFFYRPLLFGLNVNFGPDTNRMVRVGKKLIFPTTDRGWSLKSYDLSTGQLNDFIPANHYGYGGVKPIIGPIISIPKE